jgi:hypothetical protein
VHDKIADFELYEKLLILPQLGKFQNLNHPKNHGYDGEIKKTWDNYFSGTTLAG